MKRIGGGMFRLNRKQNIFSLDKTKVTAKPPEAILSQHEAFCFGQMKYILPLEITVRNTRIFVEKKITLKSVTSKIVEEKCFSFIVKQIKTNMERFSFFKKTSLHTSAEIIFQASGEFINSDSQH